MYMTKFTSTEALATWKYAVSMLGWNPNARQDLKSLAHELWESLTETKQGLLLVLDPYSPNQFFTASFFRIVKSKPGWLDKTERSIFLEAVALSPKMKPKLAIDFIHLAPQKYQHFLASNPCIGKVAIEMLLGKSDSRINSALAINPSLSVDQCSFLASKAKGEALSTLLHTYRFSDPHMQAIRSGMKESNTSHSPANIDFLEGRLASVEDFKNKLDHWLVESNVNSIIGCLYNQNIAHLLVDLLEADRFPGYQVLSNVSEIPWLLPYFGEALTHPFQEETLKLEVARQVGTQLPLLALLAVDDSEWVRAASVARMPVNATSLLKELAFDESSESVLAALIQHPALPMEAQEAIMTKVNDPVLLRQIATRTTRLPATFFHYALAVEPSLLGYLAQHPSCPDEIRLDAENSLIFVERLAAMANPKVDRKRLKEGATPINV